MPSFRCQRLAAAPLALGMGVLLAVLIQILAPLRVDHFLAFFPQAVAMYLVYCLPVNAMSILAPLPVAACSFRPTNFKGLPLLLNLVFVPVFPVVMAPLLLPLAAEWVFGGNGVPIYLPLALAEGPSQYATAEVTLHLTTNVAVIKHFLDREITCEGEEGQRGCVRIA